MKLPAIKLPQTTVLIFLVGAVVFGLTVFQFSSLPARSQKIKTAENELVILRQKNETLSRILSEIKTLETNAEAVRTALPVSSEVPALIMQLEQVAKQSGVAVQHLGFGEGEGAVAPRVSEVGREAEEAPEAESGGEVKKVSVTAVVTGSYPALQTFLRNLENGSRVIHTTNFRFSPGQKEEDLPAGRQGQGLSITLGVEAFYLAEVKNVSSETPLTLDTTSREYIELIRKVKALRVYKSEVSE